MISRTNHKTNEIGGKAMSSTRSVLRRVSLLAGSSLVAVGLSAGVFTSVSMTPTFALAANECDPAGIDPSANGAASDSYACSEGTYPSGISYNSDGDLTVTGTGFIQVEVEGVDLTGNSADNVAWDSSGGFVTGSEGPLATTGPVIDVTSDTGDIDVTTASVSGFAASHAIRATSSGGGDITISTGGAYAYFTSNASALIEARSAGGDIAISTNGQSAGRLRGILAETSGSGDISINISAQLLSVGDSPTDGVPVLETVTGGGLTSINITGGEVAVRPGFLDLDPDGLAIRVSSGSASAAAVSIQNTGGTIFGAVDFSGVTAGGITFNNSGDGHWQAGGASVFGGGDDTLIFASDLPEVATAGMPQNIVRGGASIDFGVGDDLLDIQSALNVGYQSDIGALLDFGPGVDTVNNDGVLSIDGPVVFDNLEAFSNAGVLYLGAGAFLGIIDFSSGDTGSDDVLSMPGATFTGSNLSRIVAAAHFDVTQQVGCETPTGAADCLYLPGGATAGSTLLTLLNAGDDATQGGYNPAGVTVVDVAGGTSAASHFTLDPNSDGYIIDPSYGPAISRPGLFVYRLVYDPATQRHNIVGLPRSEAMEYVVLGSAAQSVWYMTSRAVTDRQTDLRKAESGSVWMKASGEYTSRDIENTVGAYADSFVLDNSYKLYAGSLMAGMDFITGHSGGYDYVVGGQIGYVGSTFDLDASTSSGQFTGGTGGVYGSVWNSQYFLDGTFNTNFLTLDYDSPGIGSKTTTWLRSVGAQLEGGRRFMLTPKIFAEPLATVAFVNTTFEEISLDGGEVTPDNASSQRAALGLRVGADMFGGPLKVRYFVAGRAWNEFGGENKGVVFNPGDDLPFADDASGAFSEAQAGLSLFNDDQTIAGFLTSGVKFKDGYNAVDLDLGLRLRW